MILALPDIYIATCTGYYYEKCTLLCQDTLTLAEVTELWSTFLLNGKTSRSSRTTNGTVLPTGNFSEKREYL